MLKKRIVGLVVVRDGIVVQSIGFKKYLPVGSVSITLEYLDNWGIDEIILMDISATLRNRTNVLNQLRNHIKKCFVPITYGGGLNNMEKVSRAFQNGADKVAFNQAFLLDNPIISKTALEYGSQSCVVSIDVTKERDSYLIYDYCNKRALKMNLEQAALKAQQLGAGELLVNVVDRDGKYTGFESDIPRRLMNIEIPLILAGGARNADHFTEIFKTYKVEALAAGNMFHFLEHSVSKLKSMINLDVIRKDDFFNYDGHKFADDQRILKLPDEILSDLMYEKLKDREI